jgi:hypothetical protein
MLALSLASATVTVPDCRISGRNCSSLTRHNATGSESRRMSDGAESSEHAMDAMVHGPQWAFTKIPFKTSLLAGQSHETEDIAVRMFNSSLVYSGLEFSGNEVSRVFLIAIHVQFAVVLQ